MFCPNLLLFPLLLFIGTSMLPLMCLLYFVLIMYRNIMFFLCHSDLHITGTTQAGNGSPDLQRTLISIISTPTRVDGAPDRLTAAMMTATDTRSLPRRPHSHSEAEPCPKTTSALTAATAGRRRFPWRPARP